ncbi:MULTISPECIES: hypothetical protein [unclassified Bradyrhizobium]|uniref:hypothetical protein n=1 Tax=unclassified Bradyrhizobium TaxID=2631580 RepID=UPI0028E775B3|nr:MULTISPECIES: hypothetical protein [unclassified Bradyrhizobium]
MWTIKEDFVLGRNDFEDLHLPQYKDFYVENELGTKIILVNIVGHIEAGLENFEYSEAGLSFRFLATRLDKMTKAVTDVYHVSLGAALTRVEQSEPVKLDRARDIAKNIRGALLVWRYPGKLADILACHTPAINVVFRMKDWEKWDSRLEGSWP